MADTLSMGHSDLMQLRAKGKKLHRRTHSTFHIDLDKISGQETEEQDFAQEMLPNNEVMNSNVTQKLLDNPFNRESDREVIVDDIDDIPMTGPIIPKPNLSHNPMAFIKRRNLSLASPSDDLNCPIKKVNLFIDLQNIDDLTGLDTIYERKNSVESIDLETLDTLPSGQIPEQSEDRSVPSLVLRDATNKGHRKRPSADFKDLPIGPKAQGTLGRKPTHSRQSSADSAYQHSKKASMELWPLNEEDQNIKPIKPSHSKHSSIDFTKGNPIHIDISSKENQAYIPKQSHDSKPTHIKQSSMNINPIHSKQISITLQPSNMNKFNTINPSSQRSKQAPPQTKAGDQKSTPLLITKKIKKSTEGSRNFSTLPAKENDPKTKFPKEGIYIEDKNKFIVDLHKALLEKRKSETSKNISISNVHSVKNQNHTRNISALPENFSLPKDLDAHHLPQAKKVQQKHKPGSRERATSKSISPIRKVSTTPVALGPKETPKTKPKVQELKNLRDIQNIKSLAKQDKENSYDSYTKHGDTHEHKNSELENSVVKGLITKTNMLEDQLNTIFQVVACYMNEKLQLNERVKTQEAQIKSLQKMLGKYEEELTGLRAAVVCKTDGYDEKKSWTKKDASDTRVMTDNSAYESQFTENSGYLTGKDSRPKGKSSPFTINTNMYNVQSTKHEPKKMTELLLNDYKNFPKKGQSSNRKTKNH